MGTQRICWFPIISKNLLVSILKKPKPKKPKPRWESEERKGSKDEEKTKRGENDDSVFFFSSHINSRWLRFEVRPWDRHPGYYNYLISNFHHVPSCILAFRSREDRRALLNRSPILSATSTMTQFAYSLVWAKKTEEPFYTVLPSYQQLPPCPDLHTLLYGLRWPQSPTVPISHLISKFHHDMICKTAFTSCRDHRALLHRSPILSATLHHDPIWIPACMSREDYRLVQSRTTPFSHLISNFHHDPPWPNLHTHLYELRDHRAHSTF